MVLKRVNTFHVKKITISQFQLESSDRHGKKIKKVSSREDEELQYNYNDLSGYITIYDRDISEIFILFE